MSLSAEKIKELIKNSPVKRSLEEAQKHEYRLTLHSQTEVTDQIRNPAYTDFLKTIKEILPTDKYQRFCQLLKTPLSTLSITNEIWSELERVFDGQNSYFNYEFSSSDIEADFNEYLSSVIKDREFFKTKGFDNLKTGINSVLVVDLPSVIEGDRLSPNYYFVNNSEIRHLSLDSSENISLIIFELDKDVFAIYDADHYRVVTLKDDILTILIESPHDLGYCPASFFWNKNLKKDNPIIKKSPITDSITNLDRYLAQDTFKEHADLYSSYPIIVSMTEKCTFENCESGYLTTTDRYFDESKDDWIEKPRREKCPSCEERKLIGAGTNYKYNAPQSGDDPDLSNPVNIISAETKPLEYLNTKLGSLSNQIKREVIGSDTKAINDQAINELQVLGSFESRRNVLINLKESFEVIHKWANDTVAKLRYGKSFISSTVFYGDEFYLKNVATLQKEYKEAKENGEPDEEVDAIYRQILQSKYKGNDNKIMRQWMLYNLNPFPHKSVDEVREYVSDGAVKLEDFIIKLRFTNFIARFEREQTKLIQFGEKLDFNSRINKVYEQLIKYANESKQTNGGNEPTA